MKTINKLANQNPYDLRVSIKEKRTMRIVTIKDVVKCLAESPIKLEYTPERIIWMCDNLKGSYSKNKPIKVWNRKDINKAYITWQGCKSLANRNWRNPERRRQVEDWLWAYVKEKGNE